MRILDSSFPVIADLTYLAARSGGGTEVLRLELLAAQVDALPAGCEALLVASDLQGMAPSPWSGEAVLLGVALAEHLLTWSEQGTVPALSQLGVILAGDLFSAPQADRRGATGDVRAVWEALESVGCGFTCGVAGNHDTFGTAGGAERFGARHGLLDGRVIEHQGLRIGGVAGIIGEKQKTGRRPLAVFEEKLRAVLIERPDVVVLHQGPPGAGHRQPGDERIAELLSDYEGLVICGHSHWNRPLAERGPAQVLNVDSRAVLLRAQPATAPR